MNFGLYIHIPFCQQKCFYCDFPSYACLEDLEDDYVEALRQEIIKQSSILTEGDIVDTVYIGGGTPTVLAGALLVNIITTIKKAFVILPNVEITIEANPGTVDIDKLALLYNSGVNRISFGVQSFNDSLLKNMGRIHTAETAKQAVKMAQIVGFENISIDLMYGLPKQTLADLEDSVNQALELDIKHISVYGLKVEDGTVFAKWQEQNKLLLPDEEAEDEMYEFIMKELPKWGYVRYEISNFAKSGFTSRHNLKYWQNKPYIGMGAAAHSYYKGKRFANKSGVKEYISLIQAGKSTAYITEILDRQTLMEEFCFLALRTREGISLKNFKKIFHCNIFSVYGHIIDDLIAKKLIIRDEESIYLTELGMKYGNQVFCEFILN